jgi:nucleotidyltransferase/DNA polymerase involved in DNA repair
MAQNRIILHLDMDAFFAAVEQLDHPQFRGKPLIVGSDPKHGRGRGVVATASYEARKFGIHSAMPISEAYKRCPHGIYVRGRHARYAEVSSAVMLLMENFTSVIEKISIDEAFLDMTHCLNLFGTAERAGRCIKQQIKDELKLNASVGIAPNKFLAKIASDLEKPDGLVIVEQGAEKAFLRDLPIARLWGVGKKTEEALKRMGIETIGQIARLKEIDLQKRFGKWGYALWRLSHGIDNRPVENRGVRKSISQETTFDVDVADTSVHESTLYEIAEALARTMRKHDIRGRTITLKIRLDDFSTYTRSRTLSDFVDSAPIIRGVVLKLYRQVEKKGKKVRLLGIGVSQLNCETGEQLSLFDHESTVDKKVTGLLDSMEDKFGKDVVTRATALKNR